MTTTHLTLHKLRRLEVGNEVYFKGDTYLVIRITGKREKTRVFLKSQTVIRPKTKGVSYEEISAYTEGLADAHSAFCQEVKRHENEVRSKRYLSTYFPPAPRDAFDRAKGN